MKKNILLTGRPRVGKSTLIHRVVERLREDVEVLTVRVENRDKLINEIMAKCEGEARKEIMFQKNRNLN